VPRINSAVGNSNSRTNPNPTQIVPVGKNVPMENID
jgi:hypothetical protein